MSPSEDASLLLQLVARHLTALRLNLGEAYPDEEWGFTAQQAVEKLLKALIVLRDERSPFTHELRDLADRAGVALSADLLALQTYAVEARYSPRAFPLPSPRSEILRAINPSGQGDPVPRSAGPQGRRSRMSYSRSHPHASGESG